MGRVAYVNGRFVRHADAAVHIEDRGYQFSDGVYEVWAVFESRLSDPAGHFARLQRSLDELRIPAPMGEAALKIVLVRPCGETAFATACSICRSPGGSRLAITLFPIRPRNPPS